MTPTVAGTPPQGLSVPQMFELGCADVHPVCCDEVMCSATRDELIARTREHGERAHGFTPVWYSPGRLAAMAEGVRAR